MEAIDNYLPHLLGLGAFLLMVLAGALFALMLTVKSNAVHAASARPEATRPAIPRALPAKAGPDSNPGHSVEFGRRLTKPVPRPIVSKPPEPAFVLRAKCGGSNIDEPIAPPALGALRALVLPATQPHQVVVASAPTPTVVDKPALAADGERHGPKPRDESGAGAIVGGLLLGFLIGAAVASSSRGRNE